MDSEPAAAMDSEPARVELRHSLSDHLVEHLQRLFDGEWWTRGRSLADVRRMLAASGRIVALVEPASSGADERLLGFARVLTDETYVALVLDVIVAPEARGCGLGRRLLEEILADERVASARSVELVCQPELLPFYREFGFTDEVGASRLMRRTRDPALLGSS